MWLKELKKLNFTTILKNLKIKQNKYRSEPQTIWENNSSLMRPLKGNTNKIIRIKAE